MNDVEHDEVFRNTFEPGATHYFKGLTKNNGVTRAVIDSGGNSVIAKEVIFRFEIVNGDKINNTTITTDKEEIYIYNQQLGYFLLVETLSSSPSF